MDRRERGEAEDAENSNCTTPPSDVPDDPRGAMPKGILAIALALLRVLCFSASFAVHAVRSMP
jgi:hypothetical protein